ncbi:MAG: FAD-dependent monooxygenase [Bradyrhizobium sp.]|nr:FAD-dependent monooxygenase [Bradyrhizobium sp.]MDE2472500.1 FAD-dependent monooxygenase [Bradyrhizobium sp.]
MPNSLGNHAIVLGAGMAGLAAAQVLSKYFSKVTILERDVLSGDPLPRSGTPQASHAHALLAGGLRALQSLFPDFERDLLSAGAVQTCAGKEIRLERPGFDPFPSRDLGFEIFFMSRPLLESVTRRRVQENPNIEIRTRHRATEIVASADGLRVEAVRCETDEGGTIKIDAEFVVEATGRGSLTLQLLDRLGLEKPRETEIGIDQAYSTTIVERPRDPETSWTGVMVLPSAPASSRGGFLFPIEKQQWIVSIGGNHGDAPPGDMEGFLDFVKSFRTSTIYDALKSARPTAGIVRFRLPASTRRHYENLESFPAGLLTTGDALCRFNPVFGQGMSVAAREAVVLDGLLQDGVPMDQLAQQFFAAVQPTIETPWGVAQSDFVYPDTRGVRPTDFEQRMQYNIALTKLAAEDFEVHKLLAEVQHLLKPQSALREPALAKRVMALAEA